MGKQPEITFRHGPCSASVFETEFERGDEKFIQRRVEFHRVYENAHGEWVTTSSMKVNDIPKALLCLNKAYEFLTSAGHNEEDDWEG